MEITVQKWGNSNGIRIPNALMNSLNLKTSDKVNMVLEDDKIIITKVKDNKKISLKDRIASYNGPNLIEPYDWGRPRGKEIW